jgi:hypothetical protein
VLEEGGGGTSCGTVRRVHELNYTPVVRCLLPSLSTPHHLRETFIFAPPNDSDALLLCWYCEITTATTATVELVVHRERPKRRRRCVHHQVGPALAEAAARSHQHVISRVKG